jgi:large subunit ribosomal protein L21
MYAIIEVGGKQYKVSPEMKIRTERFAEEVGAKVDLNKVLFVAPEADKPYLIGQPYVKGASVSAKILRNFRDKKVITFKFIRRKSSHRTQGHRQNLSELLIEKINLGK